MLYPEVNVKKEKLRVRDIVYSIKNMFLIFIEVFLLFMEKCFHF